MVSAVNPKRTLIAIGVSVFKAIMSAVTIFGVGVSVGWASLSYVVTAEILTTRPRDLTHALGPLPNIVVRSAVSFSVLIAEFPTPTTVQRSRLPLDPWFPGLSFPHGFVFLNVVGRRWRRLMTYSSRAFPSRISVSVFGGEGV